MRARAGYAEIVLCTITWGTIGPIVKQITLPSVAIVFFRLALGMAVVLAWMAARRRLADLRPAGDALLLAISGVTLGVHWVLLFEAFQRLDVAATILIVFIGPVLFAVAAPPLLDEPLRRSSLGALALAFGGIVLITLPEVGDIDGVGVTCAAASAVLFAVVLILGKRLAARHEPSAMVVWQHGSAAAVLAGGLVATTADEVARAAPLLLVIGAVHTGILSILFFRAVRALEAQRLGVLFYLEPVSAVLFAWVLLGERPSALTVVGGMLVVAAGLIIVTGDRPTLAPAALPEPLPDTVERR